MVGPPCSISLRGGFLRRWGPAAGQQAEDSHGHGDDRCGAGRAGVLGIMAGGADLHQHGKGPDPGRRRNEIAPVAQIVHLIEFQMSFLLFIALAGYLLASRINQSAVIGEILVGLLVGPSVLGIITYTDFVSSIAHLGAVVLLFVVGLEFRLEDIAKPRYLLIAASGVVVPWVMGYFASVLFGFSFGSSVFIATALTATSIAITANVLKEMGKLKTEAARAIIGAAVIDDVLSLLVLAVGNGVVAGDVSALSLGIVFAKAVLFLAVGGQRAISGFAGFSG